jgi:hypothetical protein
LPTDRVSLLVMEAEFGRPLFLTTACGGLRSDGVTVRHVRVHATPEAVRLVQEQGGQLYVWAKRSRCCHGSLIFLETSSEPRERQFRRADADGIELYLDHSLGNPEELVIEAKGRRRKHVHAYWDGCAYVV